MYNFFSSPYISYLALIISSGLQSNIYAYFCLHNLNRFLEAISIYTNAIDFEKDDPTIYNNIGSSLIKIGKYSDAIEKLDRSIRLDPNYTLAKNNKKLAKQLADNLKV